MLPPSLNSTPYLVQSRLDEGSTYSLLLDIISHSPNGIVAYRALRDPSGQTITDYQTLLFNTRALEITGYTEAELRDKTLFDRQPDGRRFADQFRDVVDLGKTISWQYLNPRLGRWFEVECRRQGDGFFTVFRDITSLMEANQRNQEQAELLTLVLDISRSGLLVCEAVRDEQNEIVDFRLKLANEAAKATKPLGKAIEPGKLLSQIYPSTRKNGLFERYVRVVTTGEAFETVYHFPDLDEWYQIAVDKLGDGYVVSTVGLTEWKRTEQALRDQSRFLDQLVQTSPNGIVAYRSIRAPGDNQQPGPIIDFKAIFHNAAYESIFMEDTDSIRERTFRERQSTGQTTGLFERYVELVETGQPMRREHYYPHLNKWLDVSGARLDDGMLVVLFDITDRKAAELDRQEQARMLEKLNAELRQSNQALEQFAYVASHDLQEPLRKIQAFGGILTDQFSAALGSEGEDVVRRMQAASARMNSLIRDLLTYSRLSAKGETRVSVAADDIIREVLVDLETALRDTKANIQVGPLPVLKGNPLQLRQLFQNLVSNALKFHKPGEPPRVTITSRPPTPEKLAELGLPTSRSWATLTVSDEGIGFDEKYSQRMFELFQRLQGRSQYTGTGIGLAIAKRVVENHGGAITAHSQPGQGAQFTVFLPAVGS